VICYLTTLIQGGYIIANNGREHRLLENGVVVFQDDKIIHVGKSYSGTVDEKIDARGKIVSPGLINSHFHIGAPLDNSTFAVDADGFQAAFQNPNIVIGTGLEAADEMSEEKFRAVAQWCLCALLKSGCTTIVEFGSLKESLVNLVGESGLRAYLGPYFSNALPYTGKDGSYYNKDWSDERGFTGLDKGRQFFEKYDGAHDGRVRGLLYPMVVGWCTPNLLKETKKVANELNSGIAIHVASRIFDFQDILRKYHKTPIGLLEALDFLGPEVLIVHALQVTGHSWSAYPGDSDLYALAKAGGVCNCPLVYARFTGTGWESYQRYKNAGANIVLGTDTWPLDLIHEMRVASLVGKIKDGDRTAASSVDVYNAITVNGAKTLRRDDLGKLIKGAKADIILIDVDSFRWAPIADPIKSLVHSGTMDDVDTVIVDGKTLVKNKRILGIDEKKVMHNVRDVAREIWANVPKRDWLGRGIYDFGPMSIKPFDT
jgi:cytosine/adenosine deaminase-related metal-dependent hydrolase